MTQAVAVIYNLVASGDRVDVNSIVDGVTDVQRTLEELGHRVTLIRVSDGIVPFVQQLEAARPDLVFNLCEGFGEQSSGEYCVAGLLELLGVPFTGSGPFALALALDKPTAKRLFAAAGVPTPAFAVWHDDRSAAPQLPYPVILKLAGEDSSLGITGANVCHDDRTRDARAHALFAEYHAPLLVEEFIEGREFMVALLDREPLVLEEIEFSVEPRIVGYQAKWAAGSPEDLGTRAVFKPAVPVDVQQRMFDVAVRAWDVIGARDYARVDFRMNARGDLFVLEVNPNPDITSNSGYRGSLQAAGIAFPEFVSRIVACALKRRTSPGA
jgi:D-alanine-D-alanine ligase